MSSTNDNSEAGQTPTRICQQCGNAAALLYKAVPIERRVHLKYEDNFFVWNSYRYKYYTNANRSGIYNRYELRREDGKILRPHVVAMYGDLYAYWCDFRGQKDINLCSRKCAVSYARAANSILRNEASSVSIAPEQQDFDAYGLKHQLGRATALAQQDEWESREDELRGLLLGKAQIPNRILALAADLASHGREALAEEAVETVLSQYELEDVISQASTILNTLGKPSRVETLWNQLAARHGGVESLSAATLSTWSLVANSPERQKQLADLALRKNPHDVLIFENYLSALADYFPEEAQVHLNGSCNLLTTDIGYFSAGKIFLRLGNAASATEHLRVSDILVEDSLTKAYLSEALFQQGRYSEALSEARWGMVHLEGDEVEGLPDADGMMRLRHGYAYEHKKCLRKFLLSIEGKCLIFIGEKLAGERRIKDAIDISTNVGNEDPIVVKAVRFLDGYKDRPALAAELADAHRRALELTSAANRYQVSSERLAEVLKIIAETQAQWAEIIESAKDVATQDLVAEEYFSRMQAMMTVFRNGKRQMYQSSVEAFQRRYPHLPHLIIEPLANSEFLIAELTTEDLPIYAGPIIERCKALEIGVNQVLVLPFTESQDTENGLTLAGRPLYGKKTWPIELVVAGRSQPAKGLQLGNLEALLNSDDGRWGRFVAERASGHQEWVRERLPRIVHKTAQIRNGCAHSSSARKFKAVELANYLSEEQVFEHLDALQQAKKA